MDVDAPLIDVQGVDVIVEKNQPGRNSALRHATHFSQDAQLFDPPQPDLPHERDLEEYNREKTKLIRRVVCVCAAVCLVVSVSVTLLVLGSLCVSEDDDALCGPLGDAGGYVMIGLGVLPFAALLFVLVYNAFFFACCNGDFDHRRSEIKL
jgi:hypothetical protein